MAAVDPVQAVPGTIRRQRFLGAVENPGAPVVLLGAPLDTTVSFRPGTRFGPSRIRDMSDGLEDYSPHLNLDFSQVPFFDAGDVDLPFGDPEAALAAIERAVASVVERGQLPIILGGEHLLTLATVRAVHRRFPDLAVVQFDAHADLRDDYLGVRESHACTMRRVAEVVGFGRVAQVGLRSGTREEFALARREGTFFPGPLEEAVGPALRRLGSRPVYLTVDIDVLDPAYAPGVGTPEPAGASPGEVLAALRRVFQQAHVVAVDVVEVCPPHDHGDGTAVLAAKLIREILLLLSRREG